MSVREIMAGAAIAVVFAAGPAVPAAAQGMGHGVGEWELVTQGGASVCRMVLSTRYIPHMSAYRVFQQNNRRCTDWRARSAYFWVVRGPDLKISNAEGREIASMRSRSHDLYATGQFELYRRGTRPRY